MRRLRAVQGFPAHKFFARWFEVLRNLNIEMKHINSGKELTKELTEVMREKTGSAR